MSGPPAPRIALIHALPESLAPLNAELDLAWPDCVRMHLLDDSLSADVARAPHGLDESFDQRFLLLAEYAVTTGVDGILFSCSAFGRCIEEVARWLAPLPVLKPNEAMIDDALATGRRIGLVATFAPTLTSMAPEFPEGADLRTALAAGGLDALRAGDFERHDALIAEAATRLVDDGCGVIALAQFSMARAAAVVAERTGVPVLTSVGSAVRRLKLRVAGEAPGG
ncbi:MAG: arylsulfatase [Gemmatimonadetes bacterium]|nr:arylsulfatase [Gemmatimonadota bacterium]MBK6457522.1 arylsulfatase [Gemmatimonadota bacterium]MBK6842734.1 arylsulfatase [Gemmatimonadota bacterium]MBK7831158.1 arylsulfatase [Gemmatimonadota bacterium]MBK8059354.1 arylsulfatase [Gemmatimonadota bacterium]